jgi:5-methylcytosine-specific restriction endonuclease McrA
MESQDKFGRIIYPHIFNKLCEIGVKLKVIEYKEAKHKPNLFWKKFDGGSVFADMRGTELVPIWKMPEPLIYFKFEDNVKEWEQVRKEKKEFQLLDENNIPWRESFWKEVDVNWMDWEPEKIHWSNTYGRSDGYCKCCGKDMRNNEYFCSDECKILVTKRELAHQINLSDEYCYICKTKKIYSKEEIKEVFDIELPDVLINHHVSYNPEKVITVCRKCHNKIHKTDEYPDLKPSILEIRKYYNKQKPQ